MNFLSTIIRTHWSADKGSDSSEHTLSADIGLWGRSCSSRDNAKYYQLEPIVTQGFSSRVAALFYASLRRRRYLTGSDDDFFINTSRIDNIIAVLEPAQFLEAVEDVRQSAFTLDAWDGKGHEDKEFTTMCRMLQEVETFLTLRHAVKHGDVGLLRRLVDPLIIYFFGASQSNYGREMLYYRWLLSDVNSPKLQHAILASGLVNWPGRASTFKPTDLGLEHDNGGCAISLRSYKNSTHDTDIVFDRMCLSNTFVSTLRKRVERTFGEHMPGSHTTLNVEKDMFSLARKLFLQDLAQPRTSELLPRTTTPFLSLDIKVEGIQLLAEKVAEFNRLHIRQADVIGPNLYPPLQPEDDNGFGDINNAFEDPTFDGDIIVIDSLDLTE